MVRAYCPSVLLDLRCQLKSTLQPPPSAPFRIGHMEVAQRAHQYQWLALKRNYFCLRSQSADQCAQLPQTKCWLLERCFTSSAFQNTLLLMYLGKSNDALHFLGASYIKRNYVMCNNLRYCCLCHLPNFNTVHQRKSDVQRKEMNE